MTDLERDLKTTIFRRANESDRDYQSSWLQGYFTCSYRQLVDIFGDPGTGDDYKVSTEWHVTDGKQFFTIYDYTETDLYDASNPSVAEFRARPSYEWHIGGNTKPVALIAFLEDAIANQRLTGNQ